jgi:tRNA modification GTPase
VPLEPRRATYARVDATRAGGVGDEVVVTAFPAPRSYTGEDVVEITAHGSPVVLAAIVRAAVKAGARLAEPGEFTLRAFINGKRDLIQAEAVADLIDAVTPLQARAAFDQLEGTLTAAIGSIEAELFDLRARLEASLDFPDEGYRFVEPDALAQALTGLIERIDTLLADASRGRLVREGAQVVIAGATNVGKSSLFNALLNANRAIVTAVAGTTRDLLTERADIGGLSIGLVDSAGVRESSDIVEQEGVARARGSVRVATLALVALDRSRPISKDDRLVLADTAASARLIVVNKTDLPAAWTLEEGLGVAWTAGDVVVEVSVRTGEGLDRLRGAMTSVLCEGDERRDRPLITNVRHIALVEQARDAVDRAWHAATGSAGALPEEFVLADLQDAADCLESISGRRSTDDLLAHIFQRFCIGK